jgi:aldose 1-epimerase
VFGVIREPFGVTPAGEHVEAFTLSNGTGASARFLSYGGIIVSMNVPDRNGDIGDVALGFDTLDEYVADTRYLGALIGRYANRIAHGRFSLDGRDYTLATNNGPNHLHGGSRGFNKVLWEVEPFVDEHGAGAFLAYTSPDGEEGYPGTLTIRVTYTLTAANELIVDYRATTDAATPVTLTQHSYFNLAGAGDVLDHELVLNAAGFTPIDATFIPTGEIAWVTGTPFDFTTPWRIGARIDHADEQLQYAGGYDHNFVLDRPADGQPSLGAWLHEPRSGRVLEILTTEPGIQFYSGNFFDDSVIGKQGCVYRRRHGLALETEHFPDSPNHPQFPSTILRPGQVYLSRTVYRFSVLSERGRSNGGA